MKKIHKLVAFHSLDTHTSHNVQSPDATDPWHPNQGTGTRDLEPPRAIHS